jgi:phospholipid/cholesterol/gamma-HCH transport system permease protein
MVRNQVRFTALDALPLVTLTALLLGGVTLLQVVGQLSAYGGEEYLSRLMALLVVRELAPLLVAVLMVGRSATAIAAEMASMKLDREVDALYATGVDPVTYLLVPRLIGGVVSLLVLVVVFDVVALLGGFVVASWELPLSFRLYLSALGGAIGPRELAGSFLKAAAFGTAIPLISAHAGLRLQRSPTEIPQAVTRAAVESIVAILLLGTFVSVVCYG